MKQMLWSMVAVLIAAMIFAGMVLYTLSVIRTAQLQILTGEGFGGIYAQQHKPSQPSAVLQAVFSCE